MTGTERDPPEENKKVPLKEKEKVKEKDGGASRMREIERERERDGEEKVKALVSTGDNCKVRL